MPRRVADDDSWDDDPDEGSDESSWEPSEDDDDEPTVPCPYCRKEIHEDAQRCPYCENYISAEDAPPMRKAWWIILGTILCLWVIYQWVVP